MRCSTGYNPLTSNQVVYKCSCTPTFHHSDMALAIEQRLGYSTRPDTGAYAAPQAMHRSASRHRGAKILLHCLGGILTLRRSVIIPQMVASHHWSIDQAHEPNV